ncbi:unnamed protein product, partial [Choristocarpus tenellus]
LVNVVCQPPSIVQCMLHTTLPHADTQTLPWIMKADPCPEMAAFQAPVKLSVSRVLTGGGGTVEPQSPTVAAQNVVTGGRPWTTPPSLRLGGRVRARERSKCRMEENTVVDSSMLNSFNLQLRRLDRQGRWPEAVELWRELRQKGLTPDTNSYMSLVTALTKAGQVDIAVEVLEDVNMPGSNAYVHLGTHVKLLNMLLTKQSNRKVLNLFRKMQASGCMHRENASHRERIMAYSYACRACEGLRAWKDVVDIYNDYEADRANDTG